MGDGYIFTVDRTFVITSWGRGMESICGRSPKDAVGGKINRIFPFIDDALTRVFREGRKKRIKAYTNICIKGTTFTSDILLSPVRDGRRRIVEVTVELENVCGGCPLDKRLSDSEKLIEIGKIASSLAHGVRNPLNAIKGAVVYLEEKFGHEKTFTEFCTIINEEIDRLDGFISGFLSTAKKDITPEAVDLNDMLKSIIVMSRPRAKTQKVTITHKFSRLPLVAVDSFQIEQSLFNIINNALEAMPDGGEIKIKTSQKWEKDTDYALIEISDTGKGIPEKKMKKLGELANDPGKEDRGFGIFLSREVIKAHKGKLIWENNRDRGTTFRIFLPLMQSEQP